MNGKRSTVIVLIGIILIGSTMLYLRENYVGNSHSDKSGAQAPQGLLTYANNRYGFSFQYPSELVPAVASGESYLTYIDGSNRVSFNFPIGETLSSTTGIFSDGSGISFGVSDEGTTTCSRITGEVSLENDKTKPPKRVVISGLFFDSSKVGACGAGSCIDVYQYSIVKNSLCYRADLVIEAGAPLDENTSERMIEAEEPKAEARLQAIFHSVLATFTFTN